jgi:hypothetical protein
MDNKYSKANEMKDQKSKLEKKEQKPSEKNEKNDNKQDKVDRPVKWAKNKHTFVVAGLTNFFNLSLLFFILSYSYVNR